MAITREVRTRCEQLIATLPIRHGQPFDQGAFLDALGRQRGRPITLVSAALPATSPCGLLVSTDRSDCIIHATNIGSPLHGHHIVMHEVGHLVFDHAEIPPDEDNDNNPAGWRANAKRAELAETLHRLCPEVSAAFLRRILGRTVYGNQQECEAEAFASLFMRQVHRRRWRPIPPTAAAQERDRLHSTFHSPVPR